MRPQTSSVATVPVTDLIHLDDGQIASPAATGETIDVVSFHQLPDALIFTQLPNQTSGSRTANPDDSDNGTVLTQAALLGVSADPATVTPFHATAAPAPLTISAVLAASSGPTIHVTTGTSAAQLQQLINTAAAGTTLQLAAGHFRFDRTITIDRDDISVIGAGSDKTVIEVPSSLGEEAFQVGSGKTTGSFTLAGNIAEGTTVMTLTGSHSFVAGDYVYLSRDSTKAFYDSIGDTEWRNTDVDLRTSVVQVASVSGARITLTSGVHFDFTTGETQIREMAMAENVTLGGFTVDYGLSKANPSSFSNTKGNYDRNAVIEVDGTADLRLFDITAHDVPSLGVNVASSTHVNADGLTMTGAHNKGDGGNGYALQIRDVYDSSFANLTDADMRHSVVFASWTSAAGNSVHVAQTDRDINFHGGRDHDNVVLVDNSIRDANSDVMGRTLFVNTESTHYGSVTDADANTVTFRNVVGSRLSEAVTGHDAGSVLNGMGGNDTLTGGTGRDVLIGGTGNDMLKGGAGDDIAQYTGKRADFTITRLSDGAIQVKDRVHGQGTDQLTQVEWLLFDDVSVDLRDLSVHPVSAVGAGGDDQSPPVVVTPPPVVVTPPPVVVTPPPVVVTPPPVVVTPPPVVSPALSLVGTSGKDVFDVTSTTTKVAGLGNFDTVRSTVDFTLSADLERLDLMGNAAINGTGNVNADHLHGNDAANILQGLAGVDRLWGKGGNDILFGGAGNDQIQGDEGNDRIDGGAGQDKLKGGAGADVFVFAAASDTERRHSDKVQDFQTGEDRIDLSAIDADIAKAGHQAFVWGTSAEGAASLWMKSGYIYGDIDNDGVADLAIYVTGTVVQSDVLL